jgi:hypothetical protein
MKYIVLSVTFLFIIFSTALPANQTLILKDNFSRAQKGDYIVTAQGKNNTVLHVVDKTENTLTIEEISLPASKASQKGFSWRKWVEDKAPGHSAWILYTVNLSNASMTDVYAWTRNGWRQAVLPNSFLPTLLNLKFTMIPHGERKKLGFTPSFSGSRESRSLWQPQMIVDGQIIKGVPFDAWKAVWPRDNSDLSGKSIEVYLPAESTKFLSYFPYWLQISGMIGKAKVRIIDSGAKLSSPVPSPIKRLERNASVQNQR